MYPTTAPEPRRLLLRRDDHVPARQPAYGRTAWPARRTPAPHPVHDFLVPNPRPDLVLDPHFLRMIEAG
jgi:hypothetical protein